MKQEILLTAVLMLSPLAATGQTPSPLSVSPAEQKIALAKRAIEKNPQTPQPYNDLALALARRARETSDAAYYQQAEDALKTSFRIAPDNLGGLKTQIWILLGKHEFAQAREKARALNRRTPDDVLVYGFLVDANVELGDYEQAEKAAQWMLDLRPGNTPGLTRAAYLRELFGDIDGSIELMNEAYQSTPPSEVEDRAWILTQIAHLQLATGKAESAEKLLGQALNLFPQYHYALENLAKVKTAQQKYEEAVELLRERNRNSPQPESIYALAEALERAGRAQEAMAAYSEFEQKARQQVNIADNANRELIFYYADHAHKPQEALSIARGELARRHDAFTLDAYAWALFGNGDYSEARRKIEQALAVGIRDAKLFYHAGEIASKLDDAAAATRYYRQSLELNSVSECATAARDALLRLTPDTAAARIEAHGVSMDERR